MNVPLILGVQRLDLIPNENKSNDSNNTENNDNENENKKNLPPKPSSNIGVNEEKNPRCGGLEFALYLDENSKVDLYLGNFVCMYMLIDTYLYEYVLRHLFIYSCMYIHTYVYKYICKHILLHYV
jgi:hypothetical protein